MKSLFDKNHVMTSYDYILDRGFRKGFKIGYEEGLQMWRSQVCPEIAIKLFREGFSFESVQQITKLPPDELETLSRQVELTKDETTARQD